MTTGSSPRVWDFETGDANNDNFVDILDLDKLFAAFGTMLEITNIAPMPILIAITL